MHTFFIAVSPEHTTQCLAHRKYTYNTRLPNHHLKSTSFGFYVSKIDNKICLKIIQHCLYMIDIIWALYVFMGLGIRVSGFNPRPAIPQLHEFGHVG